MTSRPFLLALPLLFLLGPGASDAFARRGIPIPIIWGYGEELTECGALPKSVSEEVAYELGETATVGFIYNRFHLFYADVWTWNGRHVLYSGDRFWEPEASSWQAMLGESPTDKFGKPFLYRAPLGLTILVAIVGVWLIRSRLFPSECTKLERLFGNPRYVEAIETLFHDKDGTALNTRYDETEFRAAVSTLHSYGIPVDKAEANLREMADTVIAIRNAETDEALQAAAYAKEAGDHDQSREILQQLAEALPKSDARHAKVDDLLAELQEPADETRGVP